jgi:hypothetical protein
LATLLDRQPPEKNLDYTLSPLFAYRLGRHSDKIIILLITAFCAGAFHFQFGNFIASQIKQEPYYHNPNEHKENKPGHCITPFVEKVPPAYQIRQTGG